MSSHRPTSRILLGVTGGIAAYKSAELVRLLIKSGREVQVLMTQAATEFVGTATFQALSGRPVYTDLWDKRPESGMAHIEVTRQADLMLIAPASADCMARLVHGRADDLLTTTVLARTVPLIVCPAMNLQMWQNPATQRNVAQLRADGIEIFGPGHGEQACGEVGDGRMWEPEQILRALEAWAAPKRLAGKRILITAGPTQEAIDPVRVLTNHSSGKMGFALAEAAADAGAQVCLVAGPTALATPWGVGERIDVVSAADMQAAVMSRIDTCDVFIAVAAVADYRPRQVSREKIKKTAASLTLELERTPDILQAVADYARQHGGRPYAVGFAAETQEVEKLAAEKRARKGIPLIVANQAHATFGADDNLVTLIDDRGLEAALRLPRMNKRDLAVRIVEELAARLSASALQHRL